MILRTVARLMLPILLLFSIFLLLRGQDLPGGGFSGGLVAAAAIILQMVANDVATARRILRVPPVTLLSAGLGLALCSGLLPLLWGEPFMTSHFVCLALPGGAALELGLPTLFELGVYLVVLGVASLAILSLAEEGEAR
ncbi:MAG TPA: MnhB domain-containing protein [Anaerolineae bacterium]|nr:MnhB domain-containing protein [Anaerolineae bacterium]HOQ98544.1 MnhB domain-containing protein [Anaerolineae bacterium]HPL27048.1 MnhB domain-containing protein [Anaerolineae bacterium]